MAAFYTCSDCDKEFLGADDIPVSEEDPVGPICYRCQEMYSVCITCDAWFLPDSREGDPTGDLCPSCWRVARAKQTLLSDILMGA